MVAVITAKYFIIFSSRKIEMKQKFLAYKDLQDFNEKEFFFSVRWILPKTAPAKLA